MKRNLFVILLALAVPAGVSAQYSGGNGDPDSPYRIDDATDLNAMLINTGHYSACFIVTADIDLTGANYMTALIAADTSSMNGFQGTPFAGTFDGNNRTITGLTIHIGSAGNDYLGLFGKISPSGKVKRLGIENVSISGTS